MWEVGAGAVSWDGAEMVRNSHDPDPASVDNPVAVQIGSLTASSGEAVTTAFHGRPNTRLFGQSTAGLATSNEPVVLSDGAMIALTRSVFTDRNGHQFGQGFSIEPDELLESTEDPLDAAISWLSSEFGLLTSVSSVGELAGEQPGVHTLGLDQIQVGALLDDPAVGNHQ